MQSRILVGCKGLILAVAVASLVLLPVTGTSAAEKPTSVVGNEERAFGPKEAGDGEQTMKPNGFARSNYIWPYATGPTYGLVNVPANERRSPGMLRTLVGIFDLKRGLPQFPGELSAEVNFEGGAQYFVLQVDPKAFADGSFDQLRATVENHGGAFMESMAVGGFITRLTPDAFGALSGQSDIIALFPQPPAIKLSPLIGRMPLTDPAAALSDVYSLRVEIFEGEDLAAVGQRIASIGGNVTSVMGDEIRVELSRNQLPALAAIPAVRRVFEDYPILPMAEETTATMQRGACGAGGPCQIPYHDAGVDGSGGGVAPQNPNGDRAQILMIIDTGIQLDGGDLSQTKLTPGTAGLTHRKVREYKVAIGGSGDSLGCDSTQSGGFTHGHTVATTALGWGSDVAPAYIDDGSGVGWTATDDEGNPWKLDGVAPGALLVAYDAFVTPGSLSCDDPAAGGLTIGNLTGSMNDAYGAPYYAKVYSFSFGTPSQTQSYGPDADNIDDFMFQNDDAIVFVAAGNLGDDDDNDFIPDPGTIQDPGTVKNAVSVGASGNANDTGGGGNQNSRAFFSAVGPATATSNRIVPVLMAPGTDFGNLANMGLDSEFSCRTNDNDSTGAVECDIIQGVDGTSFASPAAAGAALLVRDYFSQGFYPTGSQVPGNIEGTLSGALVKAVLIASAEFMTGGNLWEGFRFNREQGYGRIELDNVLPLNTWPESPTGLIVADGGISGGPNNTSLSGTSSATAPALTPGTESYTFRLESDSQPLRIACAWTEPQGDSLINDIDLELCRSDLSGTCNTGTSAALYHGNFFSEDVDRDDVLDAGENCIDGFDPENPATNNLDEGGLSIPVTRGTQSCGTTPTHDNENPTESIVLSPDPVGDGVDDDTDTAGINEGDDNMIKVGYWTLKVIYGGGTTDQDYACALAGPVALGSSVRFDQGSYVCNDLVTLTVNELDPATDGDTGLSNASNKAAEVGSRTTIVVVDGQGQTVDSECISTVGGCLSGLALTRPNPSAWRFEIEDIPVTDATARSASATYDNGVLDVRSGETIKVEYEDEVGGVHTADLLRFNQASASCATSVGFGGIVWGQFGRDSAILIDGGCERDARGKFTFGFPDKYLDAGELVGYRIAFQSTEPSEDLQNATVSLKCVLVDSDSPPDCKPGTTACGDPNRLNNPACSQITVLDTPKTISVLPAGNAISANFTLKMADTIAGEPTIELVAGIKARTSGKSVDGVVVSRHKLDVDEVNLFYSTDFPTGGVEFLDWDHDEIIKSEVGGNTPMTCTLDVPCVESARGTPNTNIGDFDLDYRFEKIQWSDLSVNPANPVSTMPWNFDTSDNSFTVGLHTATDLSLTNKPANWGEDFNFNGIVDDIQEDRDPAGGGIGSLTDDNWSTKGGCGWQTKNSGDTTGGVWHTGRIDNPGQAVCNPVGAIVGDCQQYETAGAGTLQGRNWMELLKTPVFQKVNQDVDSDGQPIWSVEFLAWDWNMSLDMEDDLAYFTWELDTNTAEINPSNLDDFPVLNLLNGNFGAVSEGNSPLTNGFPLFAATHVCSHNTSIICEQTSDCVQLNAGSTCVENAIPTPGASINGTVGNNRQGDNSCFFEGLGVTTLPHNLADPWDNDTDEDAAGGTDEYVTVTGPIRNFNQEFANGPDMRFTTLEDIYGDAGNSFQAALGFLNIEGSLTPPSSGFGAAVDDMVVSWREFKLDTDLTDCTNATTGGSCAAIAIANTNVFEGSGVISVRITDANPYDTTNNKNDCNQDGDFTDIGACDATDPTTEGDVCTNNGDCGTGICVADSNFADDQDCNNNSTSDIVARAICLESLDEELLVLDLDDSIGSGGVYEANMSFSAAYNVDGILFLSSSGTDNPTIEVRYIDRDDGTGNYCEPTVDPAAIGLVDASTTIFIPRGTLTIKVDGITDNGDNDGFADTNETVSLDVRAFNKTGVDLDSVVLRIAESSPYIECIINPIISLGTILEGEDKSTGELAPPEYFQFKVANVSRTSLTQDFSAEFLVTASSNRFDALAREQKIILDLDLNAFTAAGTTTTVFSMEGSGLSNSGFNEYQPDLNGQAGGTLAASDGFRCSYNDPTNVNGNSYGNDDCFLGFVSSQDNDMNWHIHKAQAPDNGRSFDSKNSLHWGLHKGTSGSDDTTMLKQLEAVVTKSPINLAVSGVPELIFWHQVSLQDYRGTNTPLGESVDRGVVQVQLYSGAQGVGDWVKISPFENIHDVQGTDQFSNCLFDPTDDGNNEDSFFDPSDPEATLGPSSTCFPEFVFGYQGNTDYRNIFNELNTGRASDPRGQSDPDPTVAGTGNGSTGVGNGTWVRTSFDLSRYLGRQLLMRFLTTSIEIGGRTDYLAAGFDPDISTDDGWYIDAVQITNALTAPASLGIDTNANGGLSGCGALCSGLTPSLTVTPPSTVGNPLAAPGHAVELDAGASTATRCVNGVLQFQFWRDGECLAAESCTNKANGTFGDAGDLLLRDFTDNPLYVDAPLINTSYGVIVRCSSDPSCTTALDDEPAAVEAHVDCPSSGTVDRTFTQTVTFSASDTFGWTSFKLVDVVRGDLGALRAASGNFAGTETCIGDDLISNSITDPTSPANPGDGLYYLIRAGGAFCNDAPGSTTWGATGRDTGLGCP